MWVWFPLKLQVQKTLQQAKKKQKTFHQLYQQTWTEFNQISRMKSFLYESNHNHRSVLLPNQPSSQVSSVYHRKSCHKWLRLLRCCRNSQTAAVKKVVCFRDAKVPISNLSIRLTWFKAFSQSKNLPRILTQKTLRKLLQTVTFQPNRPKKTLLNSLSSQLSISSLKILMKWVFLEVLKARAFFKTIRLGSILVPGFLAQFTPQNKLYHQIA